MKYILFVFWITWLSAVTIIFILYIFLLWIEPYNDIIFIYPSPLGSHFNLLEITIQGHNIVSCKCIGSFFTL